MPKIEPLSAAAMMSLFESLNDEQKGEYLSALGRRCGPVMFLKAYMGMTATQQHKYANYVLNHTVADAFPLVVRQALQVAREHIANPDANLDAELERRVSEQTLKLIQTQREHEAEKLKAKRDRKPDPETIKRNREIIRLHNANKKLWSNRKLASKFDVTEPYIRKVLKSPEKWFAETP